MVLVFHDVTEQRKLAGELRHRATHDALTGLANRLEFETQLAELLADARSNTETHALLFIDLDQFKHVHDTAGHAAGGRLLCEVGATMRATMRSRDTLARCGGDEFAIILRNCTAEQAQRVAQAVCHAVASLRFTHGAHVFTIGASVGIVPVDARGPPVGCVYHSDRGTQYASRRYREALAAVGLRGSMSRAGNPYDNAQAESFMKTLKHEEIYLRPYRTMDDVLRYLPPYLEHTYNEQRLHSALGYRSPAAFEALHTLRSEGQIRRS